MEFYNDVSKCWMRYGNHNPWILYVNFTDQFSAPERPTSVAQIRESFPNCRASCHLRAKFPLIAEPRLLTFWSKVSPNFQASRHLGAKFPLTAEPLVLWEKSFPQFPSLLPFGSKISPNFQASCHLGAKFPLIAEPFDIWEQSFP